VSESLEPLPPITLGETPVHGAFAMLEVILVLSLVVVTPLLPIELPSSMHSSIFPVSLIYFSIEPGIFSRAMEFVVFEASLVVLWKFGFSNML